MDPNLNSKKVFLANLLLRLHHDQMNGVVTVKDNQRSLKIYLKSGHVVYANGIDKDSQLLKEIAIKKGLDQSQSDELNNIKEKNPQSLGKTLIERNLITQAVWNKFLELKVKHILAVAFQMGTVELGFSESKLNILPINFLDYNMVQLLLDTIRGIKEQGQIKKHIRGDNIIFGFSEEAKDLKAIIPLTPSEQTIFSMIDGKQTVGEIGASSGLDKGNVYQILYLLFCFGLIVELPEKEGQKEGDLDYVEIINLYLDLLGIVETNFRKKVGIEFETIFDKCKGELTGKSKGFLHDLSLSKDMHEMAVEEISRRFVRHGITPEERLALLSSFNKLVYLLIIRMKKVIGIGLTEKTLKEMMNILEYVEKFREDTDIMDYVRENLSDYLRQIKS